MINKTINISDDDMFQINVNFDYETDFIQNETTHIDDWSGIRELEYAISINKIELTMFGKSVDVTQEYIQDRRIVNQIEKELIEMLEL